MVAAPALRRRIPAISREQALYAFIVLAAFLVRIWDVGSRAMHGDEAVHAWFAWNLFTGAGYQYDPVYHGPLQFYVTDAFFFLFGDSNTTGRLSAVLIGTAMVGLPYFLRRELGRAGALIASVLFAFSPAFIYVSRLERDDIYTAFFGLLMAIALFGYLRTRQVRYVYIGAASIALSLSAMENTYITLFLFGSFILVVIAAEWLSGRISPDVATRIPISWRAIGGFAGLAVLTFAWTVITGRGTFLLIVLGAAIVALVGREAIARVRRGGDEMLLGDAIHSVRGVTWVNALTIILAILIIAFSTFGTNLHGIWDASQPLLNTSGTACPGNPYPLNPCRKDIVGGLFYWLSQHRVHRGGEPWFYYTLLFGLYQQVAIVFGVGGMLYFLRRPTFFTAFLTYWGVLAFGIYSWAGEKFPWLMIHPLIPFTLISGMFIADLVRNAGRVRLVTLAVLVALGLVELHNAFEVNYVYGADPVEMMVYVQSAPDTPKVASDILALSNKVTNGTGLHVTVDTLDTWPFAWYLRRMPNVAYPGYPELLQKPYATNPAIIVDASHRADLLPKLHHQYTGHPYRLRWWFPEDYKALTWSSAARDSVNPGYWRVIWDWELFRRPFGPKGAIWFWYYVKKNVAAPY